MSNILNIKDTTTGEWIPIPSLKGDPLSVLHAYPVGSLYWSTESTSPASLFGGSWERIKDQFILAAGDIYEAGSEGGEAEHTLTIDEMPKHSHTFQWSNGASAYGHVPYGGPDQPAKGQVDYEGGDQPHNNMPPYLTAYCWKRTA